MSLVVLSPFAKSGVAELLPIGLLPDLVQLLPEPWSKLFLLALLADLAFVGWRYAMS